MGNLTDDMTRLRREVDTLRSNRGALMQDLKHGARDLATAVAAMRADFLSAHAAMAQQTREERGRFVTAVASEVHSLLAAFSRNREDMARKGRHDRGLVLAEIKRRAAGVCKDTADDLLGARLVWHLRRPAPHQPVPIQEEPAVVKSISNPVAEAIPVEKVIQETVTPPEFIADTSAAGFTESLPTKEEPPTFASSQAHNLGEKRAKEAIKAKRGGKHNRDGS